MSSADMDATYIDSKGLKQDLFVDVPNIIDLKFVKDYTLFKGNDGNQYVELINKAFKDPNGKNKSGLITFYSPSCPHCVNTAPIIIDLSKLTAGVYPVGVVNCKDITHGNDILADYMDIEGYPTIVHFKDGYYKKYEGSRDITSLLQFICKNDKICL
jgi:thiol-disulfide isomerase/thioredoxin